MKLFLANPPWRPQGRVGVRAGSRWPFTMPEPANTLIPAYLPFPFYLAYAAALLEREGYSVRLLDAVAEGMSSEEFFREVERESPDLLLIEISTPSLHADLEIARRVRGFCGGVVLCGPPAGYEPEALLEQHDFVDYALIGEYETILLELVRVLERGRSPGDVAGVVWREGGRVVNNGRAELLKDLDSLPWPAREHLPMSHYRDAFAGLPEPSLQMWASRGCPYACIFCLWPAVMYRSRTYRTRNPADVAEEMARMVRKYEMKSVFFDDDTFNVGKPRLLRLAEEIRARRIDVPWAMMARADLVDDELLAALASAGLFAAKYGIESGNQAIIDRSRKNLDLAKAAAGIRLTRRHGIKVHLTFTFGLPGETWDTVRETIDFALRMAPDTLQFSLTTPFPGTAYYEMARQEGYLQAGSTDDFDGFKSAVIRTEALSAQDLERALELARETWERAVLWRRLRQEPWRLVGKALRQPRRALGILRERLTGLRGHSDD
jgi:anaerobic magnesium-protoporphyrin IX monomethyl ester cyclase